MWMSLLHILLTDSYNIACLMVKEGGEGGGERYQVRKAELTICFMVADIIEMTLM